MIRPLLRIAAVAATAAMVAVAAPPSHWSGVTRANLDPTCRACDDFYQFAVGGWITSHPIPPAYSSWSPDNELQDRNEAILRTTVEAAAANPNATGDEQRIGTFYRLCMDEAKADQVGITPLKPTLATIDAIADTPSLLSALPLLSRTLTDDLTGRAPLFQAGPQADPRNSNRQITVLVQSGLTLPDRAYYLQKKYQAQRDAELAYATKLFALAGDAPDRAAARGAAVLAVETAIAQAEMDRAELRDPQKTFGPQNLTTLAGLKKLTPSIDWDSEFSALNIDPAAPVDVMTLAYMRSLDGLVRSRPVDDFRAYFTYVALAEDAPALSKPFVDAAFEFTKQLTGQKEQRPRWKRCLAATQSAMAEPLGKLFVDRVFPPSAKASALALTRNITGVLHDDIASLPWMSPATRAQAERKLAAMRRKIGYPDHFRDYSGLTITGDSYVANLDAARAFELDFEDAQIGKATNRDLWGMPPELINAQYDPTNNDITFPAAILLEPYFSPNNDDAANYGEIGAVIGHEMTHGFDDQGRQYDGDGNLKNWWTPADVKNFTARSQCIVRAYDKLPVVPGQYQIGKLVQGEAIADLGGTTLAYRAFERAIKGKPRRVIDGYTPEQRFFLAFAMSWARNATPKALSLQGQSNEHAIDRNRVIGTLENMPEFAQAFACSRRDKMVASPRCQIW